jgi:TRAP-type mannitol/chloroaromatic compound transport system permease large subunit
VVAAIARNVPINDIYRGVMPYVLADFLRLGLVFAFPGLALAMVRWLS